MSGEVLAAITRALEVDVPDALAGRYFRGDAVTPEKRAEIFAVAAKGLVASLLHASPTTSQLQDVVADSLQAHAERWDDLVGVLGAAARAPKESVAFFPVFAMVVAVDLGLRLGALWRLAGTEPFSNSADLEALTEEKPGIFLRRQLEAAELTREELAELTGVADTTTIDDWLDGRHRPSQQNLERLADALATDEPSQREVLTFTLRRYFATWEIRRHLRAAIGIVDADGILCHLAIYCGAAYASFGASDLPEHVLRLSQIEIALHGLTYEPSLHLVRHIRRSEELPLWRAVLRACAGNWQGFLRYAVTLATNLESSGVPASELQEALLFFLCDPMDAPAGVDAAAWRLHLRSDPKLQCSRLEQHGEQLMALEMFQDAARTYRAALQFDPDSTVLHYRLGCALWRLPSEDRSETKTRNHDADVREAEQELWLAHKLAPARSDALTLQLALVELVWLMLERQRHKEALVLAESFKERVGSLSAPAAFALAHARLANGNLSGAISAFDETLRKQPSHLLAYEGLMKCRQAVRDARRNK